MRRMNKKGAEMTIGTLVVIVLAIIVLVVLVLGFGQGWSNLWEKITGYSSKVNVDTVKQSCNYACSTVAKYDFCCVKRDLVYMDANNKKDDTKYKGNDANGIPKAKTCQDYVFEMNFDACPDIKCDEVIATCQGGKTIYNLEQDAINACKAEFIKLQNEVIPTATPTTATGVDPAKVANQCNTKKTIWTDSNRVATKDVACRALIPTAPQVPQMTNNNKQVVAAITCP